MYLALDVGASRCRCLLAESPDPGFEGFDPTLRREQPTPQGPTARAFAGGLTDLVESTVADAGISPANVERACVASFGPLALESGVITTTPNLEHDLQDVPVRAAVERALPDVPVTLCNDATAGVVAEHHGDPTDHLAYVTFSSGIGAGIIADGVVLEGARGNAAEIGHVTLDPDSDRPCGCGGTGHWEAFAGGENLPAYAAEIAREGFDDAILETATAATLFDAYGEHELATETVDRLARWNTLGMAALVNAFDPDRVAVGGSVALENPTLVLDPVRERIESHIVGPAPEIALTDLGEDVVLRGALVRAARPD